MSNKPWTEAPKWEGVAVPKPSFESMAERSIWEEARISTPRLPGEESWRWIERIIAKAQAPKPLREPGSDDE
jgi:hypothetical protein